MNTHYIYGSKRRENLIRARYIVPLQPSFAGDAP
jgi:hypothetical protein